MHKDGETKTKTKFYLTIYIYNIFPRWLKDQQNRNLTTPAAMASARTISPLKPTSIWQLPTLPNTDPYRRPKLHFGEANYLMHYFRRNLNEKTDILIRRTFNLHQEEYSSSTAKLLL